MCVCFCALSTETVLMHAYEFLHACISVGVVKFNLCCECGDDEDVYFP